MEESTKNVQKPETKDTYGTIVLRLIPLVIITLIALYTVPETSLGATNSLQLIHGVLMLAIVVAIYDLAQWREVTIIGGIIGALLTWIISISALWSDFSFLVLLRTFTDPIITGMLDAIVAGFFAVLLHIPVLESKIQSYGKRKKN